ncbi:hypothetical protein CsSME_00052981 [Camellia sinensis var. sinensis]
MASIVIKLTTSTLKLMVQDCQSFVDPQACLEKLLKREEMCGLCYQIGLDCWLWSFLGRISSIGVVWPWVLSVGVFGVWIRKDVSDHGNGDGSGSCSAVVMSVDLPWVCSDALSARSFESEKKFGVVIKLCSDGWLVGGWFWCWPMELLAMVSSGVGYGVFSVGSAA